MIYIIGYTCQCVVTKSAQTCLTNDPKQRPIFAMCDTVYNIILMNIVIPVIVTDSLVPKFTLTAEANAAEIASLVAQNPALAGIVEKSGGSPVRFLQPRPVHHHAADVRRPVCSVCSLRHHCSVA